MFGNGKTSVKLNVGKYLQAAQNGLTYAALRPSGRLQGTTTRVWTDTNKNYVPDCDLLNRGANGECGAIANSAFGTNVFTSDLDPSLRSGMGRPVRATGASAPRSSRKSCRVSRSNSVTTAGG